MQGTNCTTVQKCHHRLAERFTQKNYNKAFKSDSQRLAFFIPSLGSVFTVVWLSFVVALLTP
ncbi:hypothetical protein FV767_24485 [Vibrio parahaemolyticus]|nr:hypothetical protein [Vibrio parahaemolyticus]